MEFLLDLAVVVVAGVCAAFISAILIVAAQYLAMFGVPTRQMLKEDMRRLFK